ncbi:MAG TPA: hypothetical protein VMW51_00185, partial [Terriglobia bacterium]|nr:hypothetical protein [Terriglobia bacterium]
SNVKQASLLKKAPKALSMHLSQQTVHLWAGIDLAFAGGWVGYGILGGDMHGAGANPLKAGTPACSLALPAEL